MYLAGVISMNSNPYSRKLIVLLLILIIESI